MRADFETLDHDGWAALVTLGSRELPAILPPPPAWMSEARCRDADTEAFFPEGQGSSAAAAKRLCAGCPVRAECLDYAIETDAEYGVWGGLSERERRRMVRTAA